MQRRLAEQSAAFEGRRGGLLVAVSPKDGIFANPGGSGVPSQPTAMASFGGMDATALAQFTVRISALEAEDSYLLDELKIGESFDDVAPIDPNFVLGDFNADGTIDVADYVGPAVNYALGFTRLPSISPWARPVSCPSTSLST